MSSELKPTSAHADRLKRYVPAIVWAVAAITLLAIPAKITSYGYLPGDDALRHAAKVVCGKPWSEIVVMREDFPLDFHEGWHAILGLIYRWFDVDTRELVLISSIGLMLLVSLSVLPRLRRPEAWLAAILAGLLTYPGMIMRFGLGRPFVFTMAAYMSLLLTWLTKDNDPPHAAVLLCTGLLSAAATWIHGSSWYLLALPASALLLAGLWRQAIWYLGCWLAGSVLGASLTGHPWQFLGQSLHLAFIAFGSHDLARQLITEFLPSTGDLPAVLLAIGMLLWRSNNAQRPAPRQFTPLFLACIIAWLLGLKVSRFSMDWAFPAFFVWLALEFQWHFELHLPLNSWRRLFVTCGVAMALYLLATSDLAGRWTWTRTTEFLSPETPGLAEWLPEPGGIIYSTDMEVFYLTFFNNPNAPWRYILGFEPSLMRPSDLAVLHRVQWNNGDLRSSEPWIKKMRPEDRLIFRASSSNITHTPDLPELEWHFAANDYWIGRLPRTNGVAGSAKKD